MGAAAIERLLEESGARLSRASELPSLSDARNPFATKVPVLDRLLSGGLPRGALTEISGRRSCGRFSIGIASLAAMTSAGEAAALVDLGGHLDPQSAEEAGVELERLLWVRPSKLKEAVASAEMLLAAGFPLVVVDLGLAPVRGRFVPDAAWVRLTRAARDRRAALLVLAPYRVSGVAAESVVSAQNARAIWRGAGKSPRLLEGVVVRLTLEKDGRARTGMGESFALSVADEGGHGPSPSIRPPGVGAGFIPARPSSVADEGGHKGRPYDGGRTGRNRAPAARRPCDENALIPAPLRIRR